MTDLILDFEQWYTEAHPRLVTSLTLAFGSLDVAHEAADEACVRAYERWNRVSKMGSPVGWTYQVAMNAARRRLRRRSLEASLLRRSRRADQQAPAGELWLLVAGLPERQRHAVVLRHVGQLKEAEIGEAMGIARGTVSATLRAAYQKLQIELTDELAGEVV